MELLTDWTDGYKASVFLESWEGGKSISVMRQENGN